MQHSSHMLQVIKGALASVDTDQRLAHRPQLVQFKDTTTASHSNHKLYGPDTRSAVPKTSGKSVISSVL